MKTLVQSTDPFGSLGGIVNDALGGFLSGRQGTDVPTWRGHFVQAKGATMIFRADDGKTYAVDMAAIGPATWQSLPLGQPVTLAAEPASGAQALIAVRLEPEQQDQTGRLRAAPGRRRAAHRRGGVPHRRRRPRRARARARGHRVHGSGTTMILRADDATLSSVDMAAVGAAAWSSIELGQAVTLTAKPGRRPNTLVAGRLEADPIDARTGKVPKRPFISAQGTVVRADASQMAGRATLNVNDAGVLTYEPGSRRQVTALWLELERPRRR